MEHLVDSAAKYYFIFLYKQSTMHLPNNGQCLGFIDTRAKPKETTTCKQHGQREPKIDVLANKIRRIGGQDRAEDGDRDGRRGENQ